MGEWEKGKYKGRGKLTQTNYIYTGYWEDDHKQGWGVEEWPGDSKLAGHKFEGIFANGVRNGIGEYTHSNGDIYFGMYMDGKSNRIGINIRSGYS